MVCCYLAYTRVCKDAYEALRFYGKIRTKNEKGVTIPSQIRYIYYFDHFCKFYQNKNKRVELSTVKMIPVIQKLNTLRIITVPMVTKGGFIPNFKVFCKGCLFYEYNKDEERRPEFIRDRSQVDLEITKECLVYDDVKI